jgi:2-keto-4-pentenoate hydratase
LIAAAIGATSALAQEDRGGPVPPPDPTPNEVFNVWPGEAPGETGDNGPEHLLVERRRPFYQISNVSTPTISAYLPDAAKATGAAILVIPGGGLHRLAIEHEGFEVAGWLQDNGIAAFVLKHRVPPRGDRRESWKAGVQDAQRAMSLIRSRAGEWNIDAAEIGAIGFSAGGEIGTRLALYADQRYYEPIDAADSRPTKPAYMLNIYPGGLAFGRGEPAVREDIAARIDKNTPPMFFVHAFNDASMNTILMGRALKMAGVPAEIHVFQDGAHGFGVRETGMPFGAWRGLALTWLRSRGFLDPSHVRSYPASFSKAQDAGAKLPRITALKAGTTMQEAYHAQRRLIRRNPEQIAGFKGAMTSAAAQNQFGADQPLHCVLFESNLLKVEDTSTVNLKETGSGLVETELGYIMGVDIGTRIENPDEAKTASEAVVPVIELPVDLAQRADGSLKAQDFVASNCGNATRVIVGARQHPDKFNVDTNTISLSRGGQTLHSANGAATKGGQWENLMTVVNQIVEQGHVIPAGALIMSGSIGPAHPAEPGQYSADYGPLGKIEFQLE